MPPKLKGKGGHRPPPQQDQPDLDADIHSPDGTPQKRERSIDNSERPRKLQKTKRPRLSEQTEKIVDKWRGKRSFGDWIDEIIFALDSQFSKYSRFISSALSPVRQLEMFLLLNDTDCSVEESSSSESELESGSESESGSELDTETNQPTLYPIPIQPTDLVISPKISKPVSTPRYYIPTIEELDEYFAYEASFNHTRRIV